LGGFHDCVISGEIKTLVSSAPAWRSALKKLYVQVLIAVALGALLGLSTRAWLSI